jgi:hypothetical protein
VLTRAGAAIYERRFPAFFERTGEVTDPKSKEIIGNVIDECQ